MGRFNADANSQLTELAGVVNIVANSAHVLTVNSSQCRYDHRVNFNYRTVTAVVLKHEVYPHHNTFVFKQKH